MRWPHHHHCGACGNTTPCTDEDCEHPRLLTCLYCQGYGVDFGMVEARLTEGLPDEA